MEVLLPSSSPHLIRISKPFFSFLFLILINLLLITINSQNLQSPPDKDTDLLALFAFKDKITQDPFGVLNSWNSSHHFCDWLGITCSPPHQRVTKISLQSQAIGGTISPYIGNLTFLRLIDLQNNSFHGEIPHEIGYLSRLVRLGLSNNSFTGHIPSSLSNCSNLIDIHLSSNNLTGKLPAELGSLSKLWILSIRRNNLIGSIPPSFGNLSSLKHLTLNYNNLEGNFPESFGKMPSLQFIRIGSNKLSGVVPPFIWNLSSLLEFYIYGNQFRGSLPPSVGFTLPNIENLILAENNFSGPIPISISNMSRLDYFDISKNNFFGQVPTDLGQLQYLKRLDLSNNHLKNLSFINALVNCRYLEKLLLDQNQFEGVLPHSIANLSKKLHTLTLGGNQISGAIPQAFENLVNLSRLAMDRNLLTGSIPFSIGKLHNLYQLKLNNNRFSGQIPSSMGNISQLYELHLQSNKFIGAIPLSLKNYQCLRILDLSDNDLNGTVPGEVIGSFSHLTDLNLSHNSFTGSLPLQVGKMANLQVFDVARNRFSDKIPSTLGDCSRLEKLHMQGNKFQGNLSSFLNKLKALQYVDLSLNNLSGEVPKDLESFPSLRNLNLSFNDLQGELPTGGVFSNSNVTFIVGNENLCGGVPKLKLPTCLSHKPNKHGMSSASSKVIIVVPFVILSLILAILSVVLYWRRSSRNQPAPPISTEEYSFRRVSYEDLHKATNGFSLSNLIGTGSFGSVYKGTLQQVETPVAVKVLNLQQTGAAKSFMAECEALTKVRHRNLMKIITTCSSIDSRGNGFKALVFKFIPNGSLESWLHPSSDCQQGESHKKLSFGQRLSIALDVAYALDYLHHHCQTPIVHCDLKPSNVLLDDDLTAHVSDFGLAKLISTTRKNSQIDDTSTVGIRGSIGYIAPEYGMGSVASTNGDIYSYGILLLEMFTGRRPVDEMFKDGLNLHEFSKMALPERVMEIVDPSLLIQFSEENEQEGKAREEHQIVDTREYYCQNIREEWLVLLISTGVACSVESQVDRTNITDVIKKLVWIKDVYSQNTISFHSTDGNV